MSILENIGDSQMATKDETRSFRLDVREPQTTNLFLLQDLEGPN
jgi:hypothetical protein